MSTASGKFSYTKTTARGDPSANSGLKGFSDRGEPVEPRTIRAARL